MTNFASLNNEEIKQRLHEMLRKHNSYISQIQHIDTPTNLKENFKTLDAELNKEFVKTANYFYRKNGLRYNSMPGVWDKIREH